MTLCRRFIVSGEVQGVFYRQSTLQTAKDLQVTGWVKNLANGDVEVLACADEATLHALQDWLWSGPSAAKVNSVIFDDVEMAPLPMFEIRY